MIIALSLTIGLSLLITLFVLFLSRREYSRDASAISLTTLLFCVWLIAAAVWGPHFFVVRLAGFFDITIERVLFICIILTVLAGFFTGRVHLRDNFTIELLMFLFVIVCLISMFRHGFTQSLPQYPSPWNVFINGYLFPFVTFVFAKNYLENERDLTLVFYTLFLLGVYLSITAFFEFYNLRQFVFPRYINDPTIWLHLDRARGPFLAGPYNGLAMIIGFLCGVHLLTYKQGLARALFIVALSLFFPAIFFTQTRSVYLCFLIALIGLLAVYRTSFPKWKVFCLPLALLLVFVLANVERIVSRDRRQGGLYQMEEVEIRLSLIKRSGLMILDHPLVGVGFGQFIPASVEKYRGLIPIATSSEEQTQHNHLLGMMVELGFVGVFLYLMMIGTLFKRLYFLAGRMTETGFASFNMLVVIAIVWSVYLTNNLFVEPAWQLFPNIGFFLFAGMADGLYRRFAGAVA